MLYLVLEQPMDVRRNLMPGRPRLIVLLQPDSDAEQPSISEESE